MSTRRLRLIVLSHGGCELALEKLLAFERAQIAGIFVETATVRRRGLREKITRSIRYDGYAGTALKFARKLLGRSGIYGEGIRTIAESQDRLRQMAEEHRIPIHFVANYHSEASLALMQATDADLGVVLGTNILRQEVFAIPRLGSINLHQGLAPHYRGGPSVFWELRNDEREIGLTIHFVASKVDTGDIILQRTMPLQYDYSYGLDYEAFIEDYRRRLVVPCANLIAEAVQMIAEGRASRRPQDPTLGKRYRLPTKKEKNEMRRRLRARQRLETGYALTEKARSGD